MLNTPPAMSLIKYLCLIFLFNTAFVFDVSAAAEFDRSNGAVKIVHYSDFGAVGDGETDDLAAIVRAHDYANEHRLSVKADDGATYYIGGRNQTVVVKTNTDFGTAEFIIDDREVESRGASVFAIRSRHPLIQLPSVLSLKKDQKKIGVTLPERSVIIAEDSNVKHYIRYGGNQDYGQSQTDIFIVDENGMVDADTPIILNFDQVTSLTARPIDDEQLTIRGGRFTTIANAAESKYTYYQRGMRIELKLIGICFSAA